MKNCPYAKQCGSCAYALNDYHAAVEEKFNKTREQLKPFKVTSSIENPKPYHYRHKVIYHFAEEKGRLIAGFHPRQSKKVFAVESCALQNEKAALIMADLMPILRRKKLRVYNPVTRTGTLRHVLFRISTDEKVMICFVTGNREFYSCKEIVSEIRAKHPEIICIEQLVNARDTDVVMEGKPRVLYGKGFLLDRLGDYTFALSSSSFYQVNPPMAEIIYKDTIASLGPCQTSKAVDAYCGIGTISLFLSSAFKEVKGIEINPFAVNDAKENAKRNQVDNVCFVCGDAEKMIPKEKEDVLFVDPPRSGLHPSLVETLKRSGPKKIAYISCNPLTLKRDLLKLQSHYDIAGIHLYDQFSFTEHLEASVILSRKH